MIIIYILIEMTTLETKVIIICGLDPSIVGPLVNIDFSSRKGRHIIMKSSKFTSAEKSRVVLESLNTNISTAELCRKHNISPPTLYQWREKFIGARKLALNGNDDTCKTLQKNTRL